MDDHDPKEPGGRQKAWFLTLRSILLFAASALLVGTARAPIPTTQALLIVLLLASVAPLAVLPAARLLGPLAIAVAAIDIAWISWALYASNVFAASPIVPGLLIAALVGYGRTLQTRAPTPVAKDTEARIDAAVAARTSDLARRYEASVAENYTKTEFVANMSHELRTPLNIIIGYTDMLRDDSSRLDAAESDRLMGRIRTAASNLLHLVDMVLDLGKLEAGKIPVQSTSLALDAFVTEIAARERIPLARGVTLQYQADTDLPVVETDPAKLMMVLDNLISNAIKFTRQGTIAVRVAHDRERRLVQFEVEDTGPGIAPCHLEMIFQPFQQLERSSDNPFGGVGLGLAIVHRNVALLDGTISIRSTVDIGTCFTVVLPYRPSVAATQDVSATRAPSIRTDRHIGEALARVPDSPPAVDWP